MSQGHNGEIYKLLSYRDLHELRNYLMGKYPNSDYCVEWYTNMWVMIHNIYGNRAKDLQQPLWLVYLEAHKVKVVNRGQQLSDTASEWVSLMSRHQSSLARFNGWTMAENHLSGTTKGYRAEYMDPVTEKWKQIEWKQRHLPRGAILDGVPFPAMWGGILREIWLMGAAQAQAIAWGFAADYEATNYHSIEVRVVAYNVKYTIDYESITED